MDFQKTHELGDITVPFVRCGKQLLWGFGEVTWPYTLEMVP